MALRLVAQSKRFMYVVLWGPGDQVGHVTCLSVAAFSVRLNIGITIERHLLNSPPAASPLC